LLCTVECSDCNHKAINLLNKKRMRLVWEHNNSFQFWGCRQGQIPRCHISEDMCRFLAQLGLLRSDRSKVFKNGYDCCRILQCCCFAFGFRGFSFLMHNRL
jgi:hypothetical protein